MRAVEFKVMDIATATEEEAEYCYVNEDTEILYEGEALKVTNNDSNIDTNPFFLNYVTIQNTSHESHPYLGKGVEFLDQNSNWSL